MVEIMFPHDMAVISRMNLSSAFPPLSPEHPATPPHPRQRERLRSHGAHPGRLARPLLTSGASVAAGSVMADMASRISSGGMSPSTRGFLVSSKTWESLIFLFSP